jgi:Caspase domain/Sulfatase-modifying factor enzyme 1
LKGSAEGDLKPTREHIDAQLLHLLEGIHKDDIVFVMFSGHGQQFTVKRADGAEKEDAFFCPLNAIKDDPQRLFSVSYLIDEVLANRGGHNLVLIDACRDEPKDASRGSKGVQGRTIALPEETAVFFSCRAGQRSFENEQAGGGHGLFTYCLLDGIRGKAVQDQTLTWTSLVGHVENMMESEAIKKLLPPDRKQEPLPAGNVGRLVLARISAPPAGIELKNDTGNMTSARIVVAPKAPAKKTQAEHEPQAERQSTTFQRLIEGTHAAEVRDDNGLRLKLVWCPPGPFKMGPPPVVVDGTNLSDGEQVDVVISTGFWLGKYELTQRQWNLVVQTKPWSGKKNIKEGENFPATYVSYDDALQFCAKLTEQELSAGRLPSGWHYTLPTEAQ